MLPALLATVALVLLGLPTAPTPALAAGEPLTVGALSTNGRTNPLGIDTAPPRLGWQLDSAERGTVQSAYHLRVSGEDGATVWDSGRVESDDSVAVQYQGPALESQTRYSWQVNVWGGNGVESGWSEPAWFETSIIDESEWLADWIGGSDANERIERWADYTATVDLTLDPGTAVGIMVRADNTGNAYMWQLNDEVDGDPRLRPHRRLAGGGWGLAGPEVSLTSAGLPADVLKERTEVAITVAEATIETHVNGVLVDTRSDAALTRGYVGFRTSASTTAHESVVVHSVHVEGSEGVLLDTDFSGANPFSGGQLVEGGALFEGNAEALLVEEEYFPLLRTEFDVAKTVERARIYASARGVYELRLNGEKVGDQHLAPGWTDYETRILTQTYDVTDQLRDGDNVLGGLVAPGWYSGRLAHVGDENYGDRESLIAQLRIDYTDGTHDVVVTDDGWSTAPGPFALADLIDGETYDEASARPGWDAPDYDASDWDSVWVAPSATDVLHPQTDEPVRQTGELPALSRTEPSPGAWVYDLGQNMVGVVSVTLRGEPGSRVRIRYGEETNPDGTLYTANLRSAKATDYVVLGDDGEIDYTPTFTFHGFRYVEVTGTSTPPEASEVTGLVWNSDLDVIGDLETSSEMLNQLQSNITWGQRGNFLSIPTDTPARDERMGWSGDINVFAPTASFNMDSLAFLSKWLLDLQDAQLPNGDYLGVAPYHPNLNCCGGGTGWSDAGITVPWVLWQSYGDTTPIRDGWASMTRYMNYLETAYPSLIRGSTYADWLHLDDPTPGDVLGTAYYAYVARLMSDMAGAVGESEAATHYADLSERVQAVFVERFIAADGTISGDSQAAYAVAIGMDLVPAERMEAVGAQFVETVARRDYHLSTGFLGTPWLVPSLARTGNLDLAYRLLLNETYPSWGYEIANGATTMWERWNSIMPDGSFGDVSMNSFNHYAYGAIGDWMYRSIGAIAPAAPGYQHTVVEPLVGGGLTHATASFDSVYGTIATHWETDGGDFALDVTIPANASATVVLPATSTWSVTESGAAIGDADGVALGPVTAATVSVEIGSGDYSFLVSGDAARLGELLDALAATGDEAENLQGSGDLDDDQHGNLTGAVQAMTANARDALSALEAGDDLAVVAALAALLERLDQTTAWLAEADLGEPARDALADRLDVVRRALGDAVASVVGVEASLVLAGDVAVPGATVNIGLALDNGSASTIDDLNARLVSTDGWSVRTAEQSIAPVAAGGSGSATFTAQVPTSARPGDVGSFLATVELVLDGHRLATVAEVDVEAESPVRLGDVVVSAEVAQPGDLVTIEVPVTNAGATPLGLQVVADLPAGWGDAARSDDVVVPVDGTVTAQVPVLVPMSVTAQELAIPLAAVRGGASFATASAALQIGLPPSQLDYVDLGDDASEQAHNLTAHPQSGTSVESGLTRRYSHAEFPGSWFELDVAVPTDGQFVLRVVETYGETGTKEYSISADGELVHERLHTGDAGTAFYDVAVDAPEISADGTVRLRFEKGPTEEHGDPSIADVWVYDDSVTDHVDLGYAYSEGAHGLTAAPSSATSLEAGLTRRYSGATVPGSWFEFDLAIERGEPFALRMVETYDGPQHKDYHVIIDGTEVAAREWVRTESGAGTVTFQLLVDEPALLDADSVRVRLQKSDTGIERHDPSVADVYAVLVGDDVTAPVVAATPETAAEGAGWSRGPVSVTIDAVDDRDQAPAVEYSLADGTWVDYDGPVTVADDGETVVRYRATDTAGNLSEERSLTVRVDATAPAVEAVASGSEGAEDWLVEDASVALEASDATSGLAALEYRVGAGEWLDYTAPVALDQGVTELAYRARDVAGNEAGGVITVSVDSIAPEVTHELTEGRDLVLAAQDAGSGVASIEVAVDGGAWTAYSEPVQLDDAAHVVEYRATDVAGNLSGVVRVEVPAAPEEPTEEPTTGEPTEEPTTGEPTEEPTTGEPTEEPTGGATESPTGTVGAADPSAPADGATGGGSADDGLSATGMSVQLWMILGILTVTVGAAALALRRRAVTG